MGVKPALRMIEKLLNITEASEPDLGMTEAIIENEDSNDRERSD